MVGDEARNTVTDTEQTADSEGGVVRSIMSYA